MNVIAQRLGRWAATLVDFCYPRACLACKAPLDDQTPSSQTLCSDCGVELAALEAAAACERCGMPLPERDAPCPHCLGKGVPHFDRVLRLGVFHDPLKHLIHQMKYHRRWPIAQWLGEQLIARDAVRALLRETDVLVPVPLHPFRQIDRGYNQAEVVARTIGAACHVRVKQPLARIRRTPMQTAATSATKRIENMRDAFLLEHSRAVVNKRVVLIDDVMTTGATLQSAARVLMEAKPVSVSALVIAVADPKRRDFQAI